MKLLTKFDDSYTFFKNDVVNASNGDLFSTECQNISAIEIPLEEANCTVDIQVLFDQDGETKIGCLNKEGIIRYDCSLKRDNCSDSSIETFELINHSYEVVRSGNQVRVIRKPASQKANRKLLQSSQVSGSDIFDLFERRLLTAFLS